MRAEDEVSLGELVQAVRFVSDEGVQDREYWLHLQNARFYEVGVYEPGSTEFLPITPLWSSRKAAWIDAANRLGAKRPR